MKKPLLENAKIQSRYYHHCVQRQLLNSFPGLVCGGPMEMANGSFGYFWPLQAQPHNTVNIDKQRLQFVELSSPKKSRTFIRMILLF